MNRNLSASVAALVAAFSFSSIACHDFHLDFSRGTGGDIVLFDDLYSISVVDEQHAVVAHGEDPSSWDDETRQYLATLIKAE